MKLFPRAIFKLALVFLGPIALIVVFIIVIGSMITPRTPQERAARAERRYAEQQAELANESAKAIAKLKALAAKKAKATAYKIEHADFDAYLMAKLFVAKRLKAPSTAKFADRDESRVIQTKRGEYRVTSWVDSQNTFGAMLRMQYQCDLKTLDGETWTLVQLLM